MVEWFEEGHSEFVDKYPNCQKIKAKHQIPIGLTQDMDIPTLKWEYINMDFVMGLPLTQKQKHFIWVIVDRLIEYAHIIPVKVTYSVEDHAKLYLNDIVRYH